MINFKIVIKTRDRGSEIHLGIWTTIMGAGMVTVGIIFAIQNGWNWIPVILMFLGGITFLCGLISLLGLVKCPFGIESEIEEGPEED
jgi:hypothetical protein